MKLGALEALKGSKNGTGTKWRNKRPTLTFQISVIDRSYTNTATNGTNENISPPEDHIFMIDTFGEDEISATTKLTVLN